MLRRQPLFLRIWWNPVLCQDGVPWLMAESGSSQGGVALASVETGLQPGRGCPGWRGNWAPARAGLPREVPSNAISQGLLFGGLRSHPPHASISKPPQSIHKKRPAKAGPFLLGRRDYFQSMDFFICWMTRACWALASAATIWSMASLASASTSPPSLSATFLRTRAVRAGE